MQQPLSNSHTVAGSFVAAAGLLCTCAWDATPRLWRLRDGELIGVLEGHTEWLRSATFGNQPSDLLTCSGDTTVQLWDANTLQRAATLAHHTDWALTGLFLPADMNTIITSGWDGRVLQWDRRTAAVAHTLFAGEPQSQVVRSLCPVAGTEHEVACGGLDHTIRVFDLRNGQMARLLQGHTGPITRLRTHRGLLVSASSDGTVKVWEDQLCRLTFDKHADWVTDLAVTDDGLCASTDGDGTILLWDIATAHIVYRHRSQGAALCCAAACDDENVYICSGSARYCARVPARVLFGDSLQCLGAPNHPGSCVAGHSGDVTALTVPSLTSVSSTSALASRPHQQHLEANWFMKKGGWKMVRCCGTCLFRSRASHATVQTAGIQLTGRKNRYCVLTPDCIKYFSHVDEAGVPRGLKGAIEINADTLVQIRESRLLIVGRRARRDEGEGRGRFPLTDPTRRGRQRNADRTWDLEAKTPEIAARWQLRIQECARALPPSPARTDA
jgi:hypothetical protein